MTIFARGFRAGALLLSALLLVLVPGVAFAKFTGARSAPLQVSTATMVAPSAVRGTFTCTQPNGGTEGVIFNVTGFTDSGPSGATYVYTVSAGSVVETTTTSALRTTSVTASRRRTGAATTWVLGVQAKLGSWTSAVTKVNAVCADRSTASGTF